MTPKQHFINHPDLHGSMATAFGVMVAESDRGAVVVGLDHINAHLEMLMHGICPAALSKKKLKELLTYPGPLGTVSGKLKIAYMTRLVPERLFKAVNALRELRNEVAHTTHGFSLKGRRDILNNIFDLGADFPVAVNRMACKCLLMNTLQVLQTTEQELDASSVFEDPMAALQFVLEQPQLREHLESMRPRYELAIAVVLMAASIVHHRDRAKVVLGADRLVSQLEASHDAD